MVITEALNLGDCLFFDDESLIDSKLSLELPLELPSEIIMVQEDEAENNDHTVIESSGLPPSDLAAESDEAVGSKKNQVTWSKTYKQAGGYLFGNKETPQDFHAAAMLFLNEAQNGNSLAMFDLGRMYADGLGCEVDKEHP